MRAKHKVVKDSVYTSGSVRVDLLGGTLDLYPINHLYQNLYTLNMATSLKAKVRINKIQKSSIIIHSTNYKSTNTYPINLNFFKNNKFDSSIYNEMSFVLLIIHYFNLLDGIEVWLDSDAPAGSGLGGSSSLGVTLYKALCELTGLEFEREEAVKIVRNYEGMILNQGIPGYQDYYPALWGGILALKPEIEGEVCEQIYSDELKHYLESNLSLIYSGTGRESGVNNWDVFKNYFDKGPKIIEGLDKIADLSQKAYQAIKEKKFKNLLELIVAEGNARKELSEGILNQEMKDLELKLNQFHRKDIGLKVCGAGGGGCFLIVGLNENELSRCLEGTAFQRLELKIEEPLW